MCLARIEKSVDVWLPKEWSNTYVSVHIRKLRRRGLSWLASGHQGDKHARYCWCDGCHICCRRHHGVSAVIIRLSTIQLFWETLNPFQFSIYPGKFPPPQVNYSCYSYRNFPATGYVCLCVCGRGHKIGTGMGIDLLMVKRKTRNHPHWTTCIIVKSSTEITEKKIGTETRGNLIKTTVLVTLS